MGWLRNRNQPLFFIQFYQRKEREMDSYDNDEILLMLDDDLFPIEEEDVD